MVKIIALSLVLASPVAFAQAWPWPDTPNDYSLLDSLKRAPVSAPLDPGINGARAMDELHQEQARARARDDARWTERRRQLDEDYRRADDDARVVEAERKQRASW